MTQHIEEPLRGLLRAENKFLPTWLLYDERGCEIYETITTLPEYYLTRAETEILRDHGDAVVASVAAADDTLAFIEIGAGTATKTEWLLAAGLRTGQPIAYLGCDIAEGPITEASQRLRKNHPGLDVSTFVGTHLEAVPAIREIDGHQVLMFLGSSIGNYPDYEAIALLSGLRPALRDNAYLILGTDLRKSPETLVAAYDDAQGVTAEFTLNVLHRLNAEYGCTFEVDDFRHVARWDDEASNIVISIEALRKSAAKLGPCGPEITFEAGEHIHVETSAKYDLARVDRLLGESGFVRTKTFHDQAERYALHAARVVPAPF